MGLTPKASSRALGMMEWRQNVSMWAEGTGINCYWIEPSWPQSKQGLDYWVKGLSSVCPVPLCLPVSWEWAPGGWGWGWHLLVFHGNSGVPLFFLKCLLSLSFPPPSFIVSSPSSVFSLPPILCRTFPAGRARRARARERARARGKGEARRRGTRSRRRRPRSLRPPAR